MELFALRISCSFSCRTFHKHNEFSSLMLRIPKLRKRTSQLFIFRVTRFQVFTRVVIRWNKFTDRQRLNVHMHVLSGVWFVSPTLPLEDSLLTLARAESCVAGLSGGGISKSERTLVSRPWLLPPARGQQAFHNAVLRIHVVIISGAIFLYDLVNLKPKPVRLRHVVLTHCHIRRLNRH